jgi:hypothetical protein
MRKLLRKQCARFRHAIGISHLSPLVQVIIARHLSGFNNMGMVTWIGVVLVFGYALIISFNNYKAFGRKPS